MKKPRSSLELGVGDRLLGVNPLAGYYPTEAGRLLEGAAVSSRRFVGCALGFPKHHKPCPPLGFAKKPGPAARALCEATNEARSVRNHPMLPL